MDKIIFLLYGNDLYEIKKKTKELISSSNIRDEDVETYDLDEVPMSTVISSAMTIPFLSDKKCVVIQNAKFLSTIKSSKEELDEIIYLENYLKNPNPTTLFIVLSNENTLDKKKTVVHMFMDYGEVFAFNKNDQEDLFGSVKKQFEQAHKKIDTSALQQLLSRASFDSMNLANEIDKLLLYSENQEVITLQMVKDVVSKNEEDNIFLLVNALLGRDKQEALRIFYELLQNNIDPVWILGVMTNKFQEILYTKSMLSLNYTQDQLMKQFQVSKGRAYYMIKNAKEVTDQSLFQFLSRIEKLDYQIKSGLIDKSVGVELFLYQSL